MRTRLFVPTLLAALVVAPSAHAAVAQDSSGAYTPVDGAELLAAIEAIHTSPSKTGVVKLAGTTGAGDPAPDYVLPSTLTLDASDRIEIRESDETIGAGTAYSPPNITSTTPIPLLVASGSGNLVRGVKFTPPDVASSATYALITLAAGATLGSAAHLADGVAATGSPSAPNVTLINAGGPSTTIANTTVINPTLVKPAIRSTGGVTITKGLVFGGAPSIDIDGAAATSSAATVVDRTTASTSSEGVAALRIHGGSGATSARVSSSILSTFVGAATVVDIDGATTSSGTVTATINNTTINGVAPDPDAPTAPEGTALQVTPGSETTPTQVSLLGIYAPDTAAALTCGTGGSTAASIAIQGIWRTGTVPASGSACTVTESGRVTGDPLVNQTTYVPAWNSPLVDKAPAVAGSTLDINGSPRSSSSPKTPGSTPTDIGALEYQYSAPVLTASATTVDQLGNVAFTASATDNDDVIDDEGNVLTPASTITWTFPGGATATGKTASFTFTAASLGPVSVTATDGSGMSTTVQVAAKPDLSAVPIVPTPTGGTGTDTGSGPAPTPTPTAGATPTTSTTTAKTTTATAPQASTPLTTLLSFQLINSKIRASAKKPSGVGKPSSSEAGLAIKLASDATLTVVARTQKGTKYGAISGARFAVAAKAGTSTLRLSSKIGKVTLKPGLYRLTLLVAPAKGTAERRDFSIRVK